MAPDAVSASPELALNAFGDTHTVTAQLQNAADEDIALADVAVQFVRYEENDTITDGDSDGGIVAGDCDSLTDVPEDVVNATTAADGTAEYSFVGPEDPERCRG